MLNVITTSHPFTLAKALFSALYSSSFTLPLSLMLSFPFPLTTTFMQMTHSSFYLSTHLTLTQAFLTFKTLFNRSLPGWLLTFLLLTHLEVNSCSSDSKTYLPKYTTLHLTHLTLLENLTLSSTNILLSLTKLHLSKAYYYHIRQLRCVRPYLDSSTACTIATAIVHSELDYCNVLYYKLPESQ